MIKHKNVIYNVILVLSINDLIEACKNNNFLDKYAKRSSKYTELFILNV